MNEKPQFIEKPASLLKVNLKKKRAGPLIRKALYYAQICENCN